MLGVTYDVMDRVAAQAAKAWVRKGVKSVSFDEMYQDACEVILKVAPKYNPEKGELEGYLYRACIRVVGDRVTRQICPASSRNNTNIPEMRKLKGVSSVVLEAHHGDSEDSMSHEVWLERVRSRLVEVAGALEDGETILSLALGEVSARELTDDLQERERYYRGVRKFKKRLLADKRLSGLADAL